MSLHHAHARPGPWAVGLALACAAVALLACGSSAAAPTPGDPQPTEYRDGAGRFTFSFPASFGRTSAGTNDGFGDRVASVRFSVFSAEGVGGEAALTRGVPRLDVQAAGGLYDAIGREALSAGAATLVDKALPVQGKYFFEATIERDNRRRCP